jgi:DNA-binding protein YbaB
VKKDLERLDKELDEIYKTLGPEQYEKKKDKLVEVVLNGMSKLEKKEVLKKYMDSYVDNLYMLDEMFKEYKNNKKEKGE